MMSTHSPLAGRNGRAGTQFRVHAQHLIKIVIDRILLKFSEIKTSITSKFYDNSVQNFLVYLAATQSICAKYDPTKGTGSIDAKQQHEDLESSIRRHDGNVCL